MYKQTRLDNLDNSRTRIQLAIGAYTNMFVTSVEKFVKYSNIYATMYVTFTAVRIKRNQLRRKAKRPKIFEKNTLFSSSSALQEFVFALTFYQQRDNVFLLTSSNSTALQLGE